MSAALRLGDVVEYHGETGTIVHCDPCIMVPDAFHSYVPVLGGATRLGAAPPPAPPRAAVVERVRAYLRALPTDEPTGS